MNFILNMLSGFSKDINRYWEDKLRYIIQEDSLYMIVDHGLKEGFINDHFWIKCYRALFHIDENKPIQ